MSPALRPAAAALLLAGCAMQAPDLVQKGPPPTTQPARQPSSTCYNLPNGFTCVLPRGYLITEEFPGPGKIMTMMRRSRSRVEEATLTVRVHTLRSDKLKWLVEERFYRPFRKTRGIQGLKMRPATIGARSGYEVTFERAYANGTYARRFFAFKQGEQAFVVDISVPGDRFDKERGALDAFVSSMSFQ